MASSKSSTKFNGTPNGIQNVLSGIDVGGKLALLKNCIRDMEQDSQTLRNFILNVHNEIMITNEKIKNCLEGNQKRIELLKELNEKLNLSEYKRSCYFEEFMDLVPLDYLKTYYDARKDSINYSTYVNSSNVNNSKIN